MELFFLLGIILGVTLLITFLMRILKQPLIIGYIISGIVLGPYFLKIISVSEWQLFSELGVAFLLFIVGLNLNPKVIKEVGKVSLITGLGQVLFTSIFGFLLCLALGFGYLSSIYIAIALIFSSTIIIMKILSDKGDLNSLYGKIAIGFLIVQDLIAVIILLLVSASSTTSSVLVILGNLFVKGFLLIVFLFLLGKYALPKLTNIFAKSQEFLLLFSVGWCIIISAIFYYIGLSLEIGALLAGVILALSPYKFELESKMRPLRDFFIFLFFIILGSQMVFVTIFENIWAIIIFSLFILIGNPLIVIFLMGRLGYSKKNSFLAGLTVAQISEFSLILVTLGITVGHLGLDILSIVTTVGLITIAGSTYLMLYSDKIYPYLEKLLSIFEKKNLLYIKKDDISKTNILLFGCDRTGKEILANAKNKELFYVADYNPEVITKLKQENYCSIYGDCSDLEFLNDFDFNKYKLIISTIPNVETNLLLLREIRAVNKKVHIIMSANNVRDAMLLYASKANLVLIPEFLSGQLISKLLTKYNSKAFDEELETYSSYFRKEYFR